MAFWLIAAALVVATVAFLLLPLLRRPSPLAIRSDYEAAIYRDQLAEVDRELEGGMIGPKEAEAARLEVSRRLLAADHRQDGRLAPAIRSAGRGRVVAAIAVALLLPSAAIGLYLHLGSPRLWDAKQMAGGAPVALAAEHQSADMGDAMLRLAARLQENPDDLDGWILLARSYAATNRFSEAAAAYEAALALAPSSPELQAAYGEATALAAGGLVVPRARAAFEAALAGRPGDPRSRYYLGVAEAQAGRGARAIEIWQALQADSPPNAPWLPALQQRIAQTAQEYDIVVSAPPAGGDDTPRGGAGVMLDGQEEMIRAMVARLAARLQDQPDDLQGWLQLARSYQVLGEPAKMQEALAAASSAASGQGAEAQQLVERAKRSLAMNAAPGEARRRDAAPERQGPGAVPSDPESAMIEAMVARLAKRLESEPEDAAGWLQLGRSYAVLGEPAKARDAYTKALTQQPGNLALLRSYADSTLETGAQGAVTQLPDYSVTVLRNLLAVDGANPQALWLLGLAEAGAGRAQGAAELWQHLLAGLQPGSESFRRVAAQIDRLRLQP